MIHLKDEDARRLLPERSEDGHKGTFGKVLVIAGSRNMAGAALLCAKAAQHTGCGLVKVLTDECNRTIIQTGICEALLSTYGQELDGPAILEDIAWPNAIVIGPGLGQDTRARGLVAMVLKHAVCPVVCDADALNIISADVSILDGTKASIVITPHVKEMSRLTGKSVEDIKARKVAVAEGFAMAHHLVCVLKDARTVIAGEDGSVYENQLGNHGMATAGSGDVLTGIVGSLLAQGLDAKTAAILSVFLHGRAGDLAAEALSARYMTASDIYRNLSKVFIGLEMN